MCHVSPCIAKHWHVIGIRLDPLDPVVTLWQGTFTRSLLTMFEVLFANWGPPCRLLVDNVSEWSLGRADSEDVRWYIGFCPNCYCHIYHVWCPVLVPFSWTFTAGNRGFPCSFSCTAASCAQIFRQGGGPWWTTTGCWAWGDWLRSAERPCLRKFCGCEVFRLYAKKHKNWQFHEGLVFFFGTFVFFAFFFVAGFGFWLLAFGFWILALHFWLLASQFWLLAFGFFWLSASAWVCCICYNMFYKFLISSMNFFIFVWMSCNSKWAFFALNIFMFSNLAWCLLWLLWMFFLVVLPFFYLSIHISIYLSNLYIQI